MGKMYNWFEIQRVHVEIPPERHADSAIGGIGFPMGTARLFA